MVYESFHVAESFRDVKRMFGVHPACLWELCDIWLLIGRCCWTGNSYQQPVTSVTLRAFDVLCFISFTLEALEGISNAFNMSIRVPGWQNLAMLMKDEDIWPQVGQWVRANHGL